MKRENLYGIQVKCADMLTQISNKLNAKIRSKEKRNYIPTYISADISQ